MKRLLLSLLLVLPFCGFAQKGMQGIGGWAGIGTCREGEGCVLTDIAIQYQNNLTDFIRITPYLEYATLDEYEDYRDVRSWYEVYSCGFALHYFLINTKRLRPYAVGGFSVGYCIYEESGSWYGSYSDSEFFSDFKFGIGCDYRLSYHCSLQMELIGRCELSEIFLLHNRFLFGPNIGFTYTF